MLSLLVVVLGVGYVLQVSEATQHGYAMRDLEDAVQELEVQQEQLTTTVAKTTSLGNVSERMQMLGFIPSNEVVYLTGGGAVAVR